MVSCHMSYWDGRPPSREGTLLRHNRWALLRAAPHDAQAHAIYINPGFPTHPPVLRIQTQQRRAGKRSGCCRRLARASTASSRGSRLSGSSMAPARMAASPPPASSRAPTSSSP